MGCSTMISLAESDWWSKLLPCTRPRLYVPIGSGCREVRRWPTSKDPSSGSGGSGWSATGAGAASAGSSGWSATGAGAASGWSGQYRSSHGLHIQWISSLPCFAALYCWSVIPHNQLLIALQFYGTGCFLHVSGDLFGVLLSPLLSNSRLCSVF